MMRKTFRPSPPLAMSPGLAAIFAAAGTVGDDVELRQVPVGLVRPNPRQPRRAIDTEELARFAATVRSHGILQPVLVRPSDDGTYELVAGERRWRAARLAELKTIPAIVRTHDDAAALEIALVENVARSQLSPIDDARACAALVEELGLTQEEVGWRTGRSRVTIANLLRLLDLPDEVVDEIDRGALSAGHGRALLMAPTEELRIALARRATRESLPVRELERLARAAAERAADPAGVGFETASPPPTPAAEAEARAIADELSELLGGKVRIRRRGRSLRAELALESLDDARALATRMRAQER